MFGEKADDNADSEKSHTRNMTKNVLFFHLDLLWLIFQHLDSKAGQCNSFEFVVIVNLQKVWRSELNNPHV